MSMTNASSYVAFGTRGVAKLLETIDPSAPPADLAKTLATLNSLLSSQENKMQALANDGKVMSVLTGLLANASSDVRCQSALAIASLTLVMQGRIAAADASTVAALSGPLSDDVVADVRAACASAVESLTSSRDGCSVVTAAPSIAAKLTVALDDLHKPVVKAASVALSNLLRLDLGVAEALTAGVVSKLAHLITQIETTDFDARLLQTCLQALWNLANTPEGKQQAIHAGLLTPLVELLQKGSPSVRRLSAGCVMAITIDAEGKRAAIPLLKPLCELLTDPSIDYASVRDVVGALKNITELPKARKVVDSWMKSSKAGDMLAEMFEQPIYDHKQWPASIRFQHQNVAPGGLASEDEAATRERWGYPRPFAQ